MEYQQSRQAVNARNHYHRYRDVYKMKVKCKCGCFTTYSSQWAHLKTKKHKKLMEKKK